MEFASSGHLLGDGCGEDKEVPAVGPVSVVIEVGALEEEMKDGEESWERYQQHRAGDPGIRPEAAHEAKDPANIAARVLDEEIVPQRNILLFSFSESYLYPA